MVTAVSSRPNTLSVPTSLTTSISQPLRASLARPYSSTEDVASPVSAAKPTMSGAMGPPSERVRTAVASTSGVRSSTMTGAPPSSPFFILASETSVGRKSATSS